MYHPQLDRFESSDRTLHFSGFLLRERRDPLEPVGVPGQLTGTAILGYVADMFDYPLRFMQEHTIV